MSVIEKAMEKAMHEQGKNGTPRQVSAPSGKNAAPPPGKTPPLPQCAGADHAAYSETLVTVDPANQSLGGEYRLLKGRLLAIRRENPDMNLFMITSALRSEGKTLVSCNLAVSLAHEFDNTVLLIDADLRAPKCHKMLGLKRTSGLSDCLLRGTPLADALVHTGIGKLSLLGAGNPIPNPTEIFSSQKMANLLRELKSRYADRLIIMDTSPILPFAETQALSRLADGILLVVRENVTAKVHLESTLRLLEGLPLLGAVYNDAGSFGPDKEVFELPYAY